MALARLRCVFLLLLYSKETLGQQVSPNNQNTVPNNAFGMQQQGFQRPTTNINQLPNGPNGINGNMAQANLQSPSCQQASASLPATKQGNLQQLSNLPPNLQSQSVNNMQITKIGFSPVTPSFGNGAEAPSMQFQNIDIVPHGQMMQQSQFQNMPCSNSRASQIANGPISPLTLGDIVGLKGQPLLALINAQNTDQSQQNQQNSIPNMTHGQNQLSDMQKQFLARSFQAHYDSASNQQGMNLIQTQPRVITMDNQQAFTTHAVPSPQLAPAVITPLGKQPPYITVQAKSLDEYLKQQTQQTAIDDPLMSMVLSEYGPQYTISAAPQKKSKLSLKSLIPLIISLLKEKKFCSCDNCKCENNTCQNNNDFSTSIESEIAQIFGGYSSQKTYGANAKDSADTNSKKRHEHEEKSNDKHKKTKKKIMVPLDTEELSDEDDSEYVDDD